MKYRLLQLLLLMFFSNSVGAQFKGGPDDGAAYKSVFNQNETPNIFKGGTNDGISTVFGLNQNASPGIYLGGADDGFNSYTSILQNTQPGIYFGGHNDGMSSASISNQNSQPGIYLGGNNDGFTSVLKMQQNPGVGIYVGGSNDGWSTSIINLQNALPGIYQGGSDDGWATVTVNRQNPGTVLPIKILSFQGKWLNNDADLNWQINGSLELDHIEVERSIDGGSRFNKIADVMPQATDRTEDYHYSDVAAWNLRADFLLYRLKFVPITGRITYSTIVKLNKDKAAAILTAYPNPTAGRLTVNIQNVSDFTGYSFQLYSFDGKLMQHGAIQSTSSYLDLHKYAAGTYQLIIFKKGSFIQKFNIILTL